MPVLNKIVSWCNVFGQFWKVWGSQVEVEARLKEGKLQFKPKLHKELMRRG